MPNIQNNHINIKFIIIAAFILVYCANSSQCHYSCKNCTTSSYFNCFSCADSSATFTFTQSTQFINSTYLKSIYDVGICVALVPQGPNALGIIILLFGLLCLVFYRNFHVFYIYCTLQTLGLFSLIQIAWLSPCNYILQSFQYLMPVNLIFSSLKIKDYMLLIFGYYRLDKYMSNVQIKLTVILFVLNIIIFTLIAFFWKLSRQNNDQQIQEPQNSQMTESQIEQSSQVEHSKRQLKKQTQKQSVFYSYFYRFFPIKQLFTWKAALHLTLYLFFLLIQETMLTIMVQVVFETGIFIIALWVIYFFIIFISLLISFNQWDKQKKQQMKFYLSFQCMILNWFKKIILPIAVVLPTRSHFVIFILYALISLIQAYYDSKSKKYGCISRMFIYKIVQTLLIVVLLIYYANQMQGKNYSNSSKAATALFAISLIFTLSLLLQAIVGIFIIILSQPVQPHNNLQVEAEKEKQQFDQLNKQDTIDMENVFQQQRQRPTLQIIDMKNQENQQKVIVRQKQVIKQVNMSPKNVKLPKLDHQSKIDNSFQINLKKKQEEQKPVRDNQSKQASFSKKFTSQQKNSALKKQINEKKQNYQNNRNVFAQQNYQIQKTSHTNIVNQKPNQIKKQYQKQPKLIEVKSKQNQTIQRNNQNQVGKMITQQMQTNKFVQPSNQKMDKNQIDKDKTKTETNSIQRLPQDQLIDDNDQREQSKKQKKRKRRIIQDPQLRKRYGLK